MVTGERHSKLLECVDSMGLWLLFLFVISYVRMDSTRLVIWMGCVLVTSQVLPSGIIGSTSFVTSPSVRAKLCAFLGADSLCSSRNVWPIAGSRGVSTPGGYYRVRTSFFHCGDIDILDAHSNIFSFMSSFSFPALAVWSMDTAVCSTNARCASMGLSRLRCWCVSVGKLDNSSTSLVKLMVPSPVLQHAPRRLFFRCSCERCHRCLQSCGNWHHL